MHKSRLGAIVIDCQSDDFDRDAAFWSQALGRAAKRSDAPEEQRYFSLETAPDELRLLLQKVEHPSRVHIDIKTDDVAAEVARLEKLGAKRIEHLKGWCVMEAPSGHRFCVVPQNPPSFAGPANEWA
jgi:predicted enzyme related to lactoylglutathione lyase